MTSMQERAENAEETAEMAAAELADKTQQLDVLNETISKMNADLDSEQAKRAMAEGRLSEAQKEVNSKTQLVASLTSDQYAKVAELSEVQSELSSVKIQFGEKVGK